VLDPDYAAAVFELGDVRWNSGDRTKAMEVWTIALKRFPDRKLVVKVKEFAPSELLKKKTRHRQIVEQYGQISDKIY
jgi:hypothetical protein